VRAEDIRSLGVRTWPQVVLLISALVAFAWILDTQLRRLYGLTAPSWDLGQDQQIIWSLANGHGWATSYQNGENFLGQHLELIFLPIAALERFWASPVVPLIFAAAGLAATAPAAYLFLRTLLPEHPGRIWLALALAAPIPFWAATQQAASDQFHPEDLALALAMLAGWAGLRGRKAVLWTLVLLVLSCKEDQTYTAFVIGLLVWRFGSPKMKGSGRGIMFFAAAWLLIGSGVVQQIVRNGGYSPAGYYTFFIHPSLAFVAGTVLRPDPWLVVAGLLVSLLGLPLLAPRWLLLLVAPLAANLLSNHDPQERLQLHYVLLIMFPLIAAAGVGGRRLLERRTIPAWLPSPALLAGAAPALILGFSTGALPPSLGADQWLYTRPPAVAKLLVATRVIPNGAPVYADDGAAVWLTDRTEITTIPDQLAPDRYVVIDRQDWYHQGDPTPSRSRADVIARILATNRHLLVDDGRFQVWSPAGG
jgi:uncharacterized membrane protein